MHRDLLKLAKEFVPAKQARPSHFRPRRALNAAYYAMFHALAETCADTLIGSAKVNRTDRAWAQVYRGINHGAVASACERLPGGNAALGFPPEIVVFASFFPAMRLERERADYDPLFKPKKADVLASLKAAEEAIDALLACDLKHRRAFAAFVLVKRR